MQLLEVDALVSNLGSLDCGIKVSAGVLTIVVAVAGGEQLDHVGGIVVVHDPAVTGSVIVAGAAHRGEAGPLDLVDVHGDAQLAPGLLQILSNGGVVTGIVGAVLDDGEAFAVGVAGIGQSLLGSLEVGLVVIADVGLAAVGVVVEHAVLIDDAGADQIVSGGVGALHDGVGNIVTVDGQAQSLTDIDIVERLLLVVQGEVVGAQDGVNIEVAAVLSLGQAGDLIGGNILDELCLTAVVSGVSSAGILKQEQGDGVGNDLGGIPAAVVVRVLGQNNTLGGDPIGDHVGAVADVGVGRGAPCIAVGLNSSLLHRAHGGKGSQLVKVSAGVAQGDGQGLAVLAGNDIQGIEVRLGGHVAGCIGVADGILIAVDHADNGLGIGGSGVGRGQTLEGVLKVLRSQVGAIAPLQAVTHREGPDQAVIADSVALSLAGDDLVVLIDEQQRLKDSDQRVGTVDRAVQRGVQSLGVRSVLDSEAAGSASALFAGGSLGGCSGAGLGGGCGAGRAAAGSERSSHAAGHSHGSNVLHLHVEYPPNSLYFIPNPPWGRGPQRSEYLYFTTLKRHLQVFCNFCNCFDRKSVCVSLAYNSVAHR